MNKTNVEERMNLKLWFEKDCRLNWRACKLFEKIWLLYIWICVQIIWKKWDLMQNVFFVLRSESKPIVSYPLLQYRETEIVCSKCFYFFVFTCSCQTRLERRDAWINPERTDAKIKNKKCIENVFDFFENDKILLCFQKRIWNWLTTNKKPYLYFLKNKKCLKRSAVPLN